MQIQENVMVVTYIMHHYKNMRIKKNKFILRSVHTHTHTYIYPYQKHDVIHEFTDSIFNFSKSEKVNESNRKKGF